MPQAPEGPPPYLDERLAPLSDNERFALTVGMELTRLERINWRLET